jgi:hypothetical protein
VDGCGVVHVQLVHRHLRLAQQTVRGLHFAVVIGIKTTAYLQSAT